MADKEEVVIDEAENVEPIAVGDVILSLSVGKEVLESVSAPETIACDPVTFKDVCWSFGRKRVDEKSQDGRLIPISFINSLI